MISFARERLVQLGDGTAAAIDAGFVRFRPVLMTALGNDYWYDTYGLWA